MPPRNLPPLYAFGWPPIRAAAFLLGVAILLAAAGQKGRAQEGADPPAASTAPVTLAQCYERARQISETLGISDENIRLVEAQYKTALGSILPHLYWVKTQEYQDQPNSSTNAGVVGNALTRSPLPQSSFQLQQPLFSGGKDWAALGIARSAKTQAQMNRAQADEQLLSD